MPLVQFSYPPKQINLHRFMSPPRKYQDLPSWLKQARKVLPQIPDCERTDWFIWDTIVTLQTIIFELRDSVGNRCAVAIDRRATQFQIRT